MRTIERADPLLAEFVTTTQAAAMIGVDRKTLERWRLDNQGPPFTRLPPRVLYRRADVEQWCRARGVDPRPVITQTKSP